jgi:hypothetical protein
MYLHSERIDTRIPEPLQPREVLGRYYLKLYRKAGRRFHLAANLGVFSEGLLFIGSDPGSEHDVRDAVELLRQLERLDQALRVLETDGTPVLEGELDAAELAPPLVLPEIARLKESGGERRRAVKKPYALHRDAGRRLVLLELRIVHELHLSDGDPVFEYPVFAVYLVQVIRRRAHEIADDGDVRLAAGEYLQMDTPRRPGAAAPDVSRVGNPQPVTLQLHFKGY